MLNRTFNDVVDLVAMARAATIRRLADERGASLVEYALLLALIAIVCIAAVTLLGSATGDSISRTADSVAAAN